MQLRRIYQPLYNLHTLYFRSHIINQILYSLIYLCPLYFLKAAEFFPKKMSTKKELKKILADRGFHEDNFYTFRPHSLQEYRDRVRATDPDVIPSVIFEIARLAKTDDITFIQALFDGLDPTPSNRGHHAAIIFYKRFKFCPENFSVWKHKDI